MTGKLSRRCPYDKKKREREKLKVRGGKTSGPFRNANKTLSLQICDNVFNQHNISIDVVLKHSR